MLQKEFAKIGKHMLRQLSSTVEYYKESETNSSSPFESPSYIIHSTRLSRLQILQFLYYHFLHVDKNGIIRSVSEKEIAHALNCTVKTVRNNNIVLENIGLIYHSRAGKMINIMIVNYPSYFESNGYGYIELSFNRFQELAKIDNVNALRLEIRKELVYDNNELRRKYRDEKVCKISFNDFKAMLPKYLHYNRMVQFIAQKGTAAFKTIVQKNSIFFELNKDVKTSKELKKEREELYVKQITNHLQENKVLSFFDEADIKDFVQLSFEYTLEHVLNALNELIDINFYKGTEVTRNFGAKLRTIIRQTIFYESDYKPPIEISA